MLSVLLGTPEGRWLGSRALQPVATLAYSLYLVHLPLMPLAEVLAQSWQVGSPGMQLLLFLPSYLLLSIAVAALLHLLIEKPFLVVKDHLR